MTDEEKAEATVAHLLVANIATKLRAAFHGKGDDLADVLTWVATQDDAIITRAIVATQPTALALGTGLLVDSMSSDQRVGMLVSLVAVWVQAR